MAYIPEAHKQYRLFPMLAETGGEIILFPEPKDFDIQELLPDGESIYPYSIISFFWAGDYASYYAKLDDLVLRFGMTGGKLNDLGDMIVDFKKCVQEMNVKENWSVLKYVGESDHGLVELTHGWHYYWACSVKPLKFEGVIDDEGMPLYTNYTPDSSFWVSIRDLWEIAEDPTGIAAQLLKK